MIEKLRGGQWEEHRSPASGAWSEKPGRREAGRSTPGKRGLSPADLSQEPNLPLEAEGAGERGATAGVTRSSLRLKTVTPAALQGTAWKKAGGKGADHQRQLQQAAEK